ncbi:MAG: ATP-dependent helicase HrpB [Halioglobus sp.]|nr:ATP-dependent helicase HrpB [Halioglobus sp.]|tara:strand:+ start:264 stop:2840 length:2577 start_codon:yes stop_codon:yes gene_type:complete
MFDQDTSALPVNEILDELKLRLSAGDEVVLQAPPGAGKTTLVPLALLNESWLGKRKILVLEPRRMATRSAAARMAQILGEDLGETVGYRMRLDSCVSERTRIEVVTEGILTRQLQRDPGLEDVGLVIFDEFHERNLDSDLCLALCLLGRESYREGPALKLLVMSATLDGDPVSRLLGDAPVLTSQGRQFPVDTHYGEPYQLRDSIVAPAARAVQRALLAHAGSILVFLPGQREIRAVAQELSAALRRSGDDRVHVEPLYGGMSLERQRQVIRAAAPGTRKVVLATNVAETSLTIEGIEVVIDSGLVREAVFDPVTGMTRLTTRRVSRASADQRRGRAGRLGPGVCYRLWSEQQQSRLVAHATPEILQEDLAPMALQLLSWGIDEPAELQWLDTPPDAPYQQAIAILELCGAAFSSAQGQHQLTPHGVRLAQMPLHPRLAHMLLVGCDIHATETACLLAAILSERNPLAEGGVDIAVAVAVLMGEDRCPPSLQGWFKRTWQQARRFARLASEIHKPRKFALGVAQEDILGILLASAYPDRIARLRPGDDPSRYQLSNGRTALLPADDSLVGQEWLAVAELGGQVGAAEDRIYSASRLNPDTFREILSTLVTETDNVEWDYRNERFVAERHHMVGKIRLSVEPLQDVADDVRSRALLEVVRRKGLEILPWTRNLEQWRARIQLVHQAHRGSGANENPWPDLSEQGLLGSLEEWLMPYLGDVRRLQDFQQLDLKGILRGLLPWPLPLELERLAPERWAAPSGSSIVIDYEQDPPVLAIKLQEMFGCEETPSIADGAVALQVHLLSPAGRPLQVTQDLAGFWRGEYAAVRKEMRGRYPKHPWPENPLDALPTRETKRRAGSS